MDKTTQARQDRKDTQESEQMVRELYQAVIGIKDTADTGMIGDIKDIKSHLAKLNGQVVSNTMFRKIGTWVACALITGLISVCVKLFTG
jgi:hypothetical protein